MKESEKSAQQFWDEMDQEHKDAAVFLMRIFESGMNIDQVIAMLPEDAVQEVMKNQDATEDFIVAMSQSFARLGTLLVMLITEPKKAHMHRVDEQWLIHARDEDGEEMIPFAQYMGEKHVQRNVFPAIGMN